MAFEDLDLMAISSAIAEARKAENPDEKIEKALDALEGVLKYLRDARRGQRDLMGLTMGNFQSAIR